MYEKELFLQNKLLIQKIIDNIVNNVKFYKTESGYYLTTDELRSKKLLDDYKISYIRLYKHIPTNVTVLYVKFNNDDSVKIFECVL